MAKKQIDKSITPPSVDTKLGIELLNKLIQKAEEALKGQRITYDMDSAWETLAENYLIKVFGSDSPNVTKVMDAGRPGSFSVHATEDWWENQRRKGFTSRITQLKSLIEVLETSMQLPSEAIAKQHAVGNKIFIVHGHNDGIKETIARFIEKLGMEAVILHEKANKGRTLIEKFEEECKEVGFAIVVMTKDDRGGTSSESYETQRPRARQNVILELGFFLGRLGRGRVGVLYEEEVEIPSDYSGVVFTKLDAGGAWRLSLAKEMKAAGFAIDMNLAV